MNIFVLHPNPRKCAQMHCDKHVVKMILEHCQLMYTAIHELAPEHLPDGAYKKTHVNHPCAKWVRASKHNFVWLLLLTYWLCQEKKYRYGGKRHKCEDHLRPLLQACKNIHWPKITFTPWAIANPYKHMKPIDSYRHYYLNDKQHLLQYKIRQPPQWCHQDVFTSHTLCNTFQ